VLSEHFKKYFELVFVNSEELKQHVYNIRHQVYCEELGWEQERNSKIETDEYDEFAYYCLLKHKSSGTYAGTIRMIIPPVDAPRTKLPLEDHCLSSLTNQELNPELLTAGSYSEISRLCVSSSFRRRPNEQDKPFAFANVEGNGNALTEEELRLFPNIAMGLYLSVMALANQMHHDHMFVVVEPRLAKRLHRFGLKFERIGDNLDYHGERAIFYLPKDKFIADLKQELRDLYDVVEEMLLSHLKLIPYAQ